ncbi:MAG: hypothetical protein K2X93_04795 [Candidatus Obscuribacterales bacterium]|nr:hypothetical protein [Candidatus Obscuribacterales bacterium]
MTTKLSSLQLIANEAPHDQVRDLVLPVKASNGGYLGELFYKRPARLRRLDTGQLLDVQFDKTAVSMAFRPVDSTAVNAERNHEVAFGYGQESVKVDRYDIALRTFLEPIWFPRAQSVEYSQQGDKLAIGGGTGRLSVWQLGDGHGRKELFSIEVAKSAIVRIAFTGHGESVYVLTAGGAAFRVELASQQITRTAIFDPAEDDLDFECWAHALHRDARLGVLAGSVNRKAGRCKVWLVPLDGGRPRAILTGHKLYVRRVQFIGKDQLIVFGDQGAEVHDLPTKSLCRMTVHGDSLVVAYAAFQVGTSAFVFGSKATSPGRREPRM